MIEYFTMEEGQRFEASVTQVALLRHGLQETIVGHGNTQKRAFLVLIHKLINFLGKEVTEEILLGCKLLQCERQWLAASALSAYIPTDGT